MEGRGKRGVLALAFWAGLAAASGDSPTEEAKAVAFEITSRAFAAGGAIPVEHTCDGADLSPPLAWTGVPDGVEAYALIMDDPDAPPGTWVHWIVYDLPAGAAGLPEGLPEEEQLADGVRQGLVWGVERFSRVGYHGPCPPPGAPHRYFFKLYALDTALDLAPRATKAQVEQAMAGHVLAQAQLMGTYRR